MMIVIKKLLVYIIPSHLNTFYFRFNLQTRMGGSRSGSVQSFDEALREATANQAAAAGATNPDGTVNRPNGTPTATTPSAEEKPLS